MYQLADSSIPIPQQAELLCWQRTGKRSGNPGGKPRLWWWLKWGKNSSKTATMCIQSPKCKQMTFSGCLNHLQPCDAATGPSAHFSGTSIEGYVSCQAWFTIKIKPCQNSYWKWPFIDEFPIKNGAFHSYVSLPEGKLPRNDWAVSKAAVILSCSLMFRII